MSSSHSPGGSGDTSPLMSEKSSNSEIFEDLSTDLGMASENLINSEAAVPKSPISNTENPSILISNDIDHNLPDTVNLLTTEHGAKVYLVGTAHFSVESQNDVSQIIQAVQPDIVIIELCPARLNILQLDEETILQEAKNINFEKILTTIRQNGLMNGVMYILLLNMSAYITKELGMAPGGEFRTAFQEAKKVPHCVVHLGDRPISITLQRALSSLSWWQTIKLGWNLLTSKEPITKEDVEKCKRRDLLEELISQMTGEFPALGEVFVNERDIYLTHSLQIASIPHSGPNGLLKSPKVVGVVGIGHLQGITKLWPVRQSKFVNKILIVPPPSLTSKVIKISLRLTVVGLIGYAGYKLIPKFVKLNYSAFNFVKEKLV